MTVIFGNTKPRARALLRSIAYFLLLAGWLSSERSHGSGCPPRVVARVSRKREHQGGGCSSVALEPVGTTVVLRFVPRRRDDDATVRDVTRDRTI